MDKTDIVFCLLTYKNVKDLESFINNLKEKKNNFSYKLVVVDNFYNEETTKKIEEISYKNNCDFISIENKGYGHGNNVGIKFALDNYEFKYLAVCNPDTLIIEFDLEDLKDQEKSIIAPEVFTLKNKRQNPLNFKYMPVSEKIIYLSFKKDNKILLYMGIGIIKINRIIGNILRTFKKSQQEMVHAAHGSFIIFSEYALKKLYPVFDENIFLFCEEGDLARKSSQQNINIIFNKNIIIRHKEDGSMNMSNRNLNKIHKQSYIYYYEKWLNAN